MADNGVAAFRSLARDFQQAGASGCRKRLYAALYRAARPATEAAKESARTSLPSSGGKGRRRTRLVTTGRVTVDGQDYVRRRRKAMSSKTTESLAERVAGARYGVKAIGGKNPAVRIIATGKGKKKIDLNQLDAGIVRHPLFGDRKHWYQQRVTPGWFTRPIQGQAGNVLAELEKAVQQIENDITGS